MFGFSVAGQILLGEVPLCHRVVGKVLSQLLPIECPLWFSLVPPAEEDGVDLTHRDSF